MNVLGIETSCDETAAAVVTDGRVILSNVVVSSLKFHRKYGGVVPEIASRMQLETITQVTQRAIRQAGIKLRDINLVSVTSGPGLLGSLAVGISFAKSLSYGLGIPLVGVNHLLSHIYAVFLSKDSPKFPLVALVVSGGHTNLFLLKDFDAIELLGSTLDDACGEAFDKVAKILGLGYPGGPVIEKLARQGDPKKIKFSCSGTDRPLDFSFSGIKTAVLYAVRDKRLTLNEKKDIAASFQEAVFASLIKKSLLACKLKKTKRLVVGGGVAVNQCLRNKFLAEARKNNLSLKFPTPHLCLDNAAMVAGLGYQLFIKSYCSDLSLSVDLN
ncbi:MAG: tRNA (adenosine(37)-N6)-threonylcarbamoyltransferase complex transferase subunit TsaD [Candidatus Omnitrophica bacterium]|nr:tRNA (adenosine(37)-N6)-threonylcarbamoyltransferase complex transferase subunit TsaD [Candidatus Omnitrophota bacterium]